LVFSGEFNGITFVINITFRRANQPTNGEIPFEFMPVVHISGLYTILLGREKLANVHHRGAVKNREAFERRTTIRARGNTPREIRSMRRRNTIFVGDNANYSRKRGRERIFRG